MMPTKWHIPLKPVFYKVVFDNTVSMLPQTATSKMCPKFCYN